MGVVGNCKLPYEEHAKTERIKMKKSSGKKAEISELNFMDFEIPLLSALIKLGGSAKPVQVYPEVEKIMKLGPKTHPKEVAYNPSVKLRFAVH